MICKTRVYSYRDWWIISVCLSTVIHRCTLCVRGDIAMRRASRAAARDWLSSHQAARLRLGSHLHTSRAICIPTAHYVPSHPRLIVLYYMFNAHNVPHASVAPTVCMRVASKQNHVATAGTKWQITRFVFKVAAYWCYSNVNIRSSRRKK